MGRVLRVLLAGGLIAAGATIAIAQSANDPGQQLTDIRTKLISDDYRVREQGRASLAKIPPSAIETLRAAEKGEADEEVRARLRARINEMELYTLVHPPALTLEKGDYTFAEIAASLNKQLGTESLIVSGDNRKVPMVAVNQPFWEIMRQFNERQPFNISALSSASTKSTPNNQFRLSQLNLNTNPQSLTVYDSFAIVAPGRAQASSDGWSIRSTIYCDPRVKVARYDSILRVDQIISSKGESLLHLFDQSIASLSSPSRPVPTFQASFALRGSVNLARTKESIKELRGRITMMVVESEHTISLDLTREKVEPVATSVGTFGMQTDAAGNRILTMDVKNADGTPVATANLPILSLRLVDKQGKVVQTVSTRATAIPLTQLIAQLVGRAGGGAAPADITSVEFTVVDKSREYILPVVLKDIELPPLLPAPPGEVRLEGILR